MVRLESLISRVMELPGYVIFVSVTCQVLPPALAKLAVRFEWDTVGYFWRMFEWDTVGYFWRITRRASISNRDNVFSELTRIAV
jgi:hypothetical protein